MRELDDVRFFEVIARSVNLTEVGRELGVSVSAVSKRRSRIESRLGVRLVNRSTRRLTFTTEGDQYAAGARVISADLDELEESVSGRYANTRGHLRIHSTVGLGRRHIAPLIAEFVDANRRVDVDLELSAKLPTMSAEPFDIAIRVGSLQNSRLTVSLLCRNRRVVVASPEYSSGNTMPQTIADLRDHNCIVLRQDEGDFALWRFGTATDETVLRVAGNMVSNDGDVTTQWCLEGRGLLMRSLWHVAPMLRDGSLVQVLPDIGTPPADIYAVYSGAEQIPRRVRAAVEFFQKNLARRIITVDH